MLLTFDFGSLVSNYGLVGFLVAFLCFLLWHMVSKFSVVISSNTVAISRLESAISDLCSRLGKTN